MLSTTTIAGRVGADPQLKTIKGPNGDQQVAEIRVAVEDFRLGRDEVRWVEVAQFDAGAQRLVDYVTKGQHVTCEGLLDARAYVGNDGEPHVDWKLRRAVVEYGPRPRPNSPEGADD